MITQSISSASNSSRTAARSPIPPTQSSCITPLDRQFTTAPDNSNNSDDLQSQLSNANEFSSASSANQKYSSTSSSSNNNRSSLAHLISFNDSQPAELSRSAFTNAFNSIDTGRVRTQPRSASVARQINPNDFETRAGTIASGRFYHVRKNAANANVSMSPSSFVLDGSEHIYECVDPNSYAFVGSSSLLANNRNSQQASTVRYNRAGLMTTGSRGRQARVRNSQQFLMTNDDELPDLLLQYSDRPSVNARAFATLNVQQDRL